MLIYVGVYVDKHTDIMGIVRGLEDVRGCEEYAEEEVQVGHTYLCLFQFVKICTIQNMIIRLS